MGCGAIFSFNLKEDDTPLDQAIFSSANNAIYGVRGQWVYKFNATTGRKEAEAVIASDILGPSSICDHNGTLYVSCWWSVEYPQPVAWRDNVDFYTINPTTLAATNTQIWKTYKASADSYEWSWGPMNIVSGGTRLMGLFGDGSSTIKPFSVDPANPAGWLKASFGNSTYGGGVAGAELIFDSTNNLLVAAWGRGQIVQQWDNTVASFNTTGGGFTKRPCGICYCPTNDTYYLADNTSLLPTVDAATMNTVGSVNTGEATANPRRIKYNSVDGFIYVPGWFSNSVIVINPATNTVVATKTGFNMPWDVVFAGSKKFAVQNSSVGLMEIV